MQDNSYKKNFKNDLSQYSIDFTLNQSSKEKQLKKKPVNKTL